MDFCSQQVEQARLKYKNLQYGNHQLTISFNQKKQYTFILTFGDFPTTPPAIVAKTTEKQYNFQPPIVKYWNSLYTVTDILEQLEYYSMLPSPTQFHITIQDIQTALNQVSRMYLADPNQRNQVIQQATSKIKAIQESQEYLRKTTEKCRQQEPERQQNVQRLQQINRSIQQMQREMSQFNQAEMTQQLIKAKIARLNEMYKEYEKRANEAKTQFQNQKIDLNTFLDTFTREKENALKCKNIINSLRTL